MTSKPRIAWLHTHFLLNTGGTRYVHEVISRLAKEYSITVFVEKSNPEWKEKFSSSGIKVVEILPLSSNSPFYWLLFPYWLRRDLAFLKTAIQGFDLVVTSMFPMNWLSTQLDRATVQICFEPFAFFHDDKFVESFPVLKQIFTRFMGRLYKKYDVEGSRTSERLLVLNEGVGEWVQKLYNRTASGTTRIGVNISLFKPTPDTKLAARYRGFKLLMHSTDYTSIKGTEFLIEILPSVIKKVKNLKVLITESVSDLAAKKKLVDRAKELGILSHLEFLGSLPYTDLPKYYTLVNAYVFTGHPQSKGATSASLSVLESLACGTPVVRGVGTDDEVIEGKSGFVVDPRNKADFAHAVIKLLTNPSLAGRMGKWGQKYVHDNFTWEHVVGNISAHVNVLLDLHQQGFELVKHENKLVGMVFRSDTPIPGLKFFTDDMNPFQVGIHNQPGGIKLVPHVHVLAKPLTINTIQEFISVQKGKARLTFYTRGGKSLQEFILNAGDSALFVSEGHGVDFLEDTRLLIIKQGPYPGTQHAKLYLKS